MLLLSLTHNKKCHLYLSKYQILRQSLKLV